MKLLFKTIYIEKRILVFGKVARYLETLVFSVGKQQTKKKQRKKGNLKSDKN